MGYMIKRPRGESLIQSVCIVEGCDRKQSYKAKNSRGQKRYSPYCDMHRKKLLNVSTPPEKFFVVKSIKNDICAICGWQGPCDRHRKIPQKGYLPRNVYIICPNCHRLITVGLLEIDYDTLPSYGDYLLSIK